MSNDIIRRVVSDPAAVAVTNVGGVLTVPEGTGADPTFDAIACTSLAATAAVAAGTNLTVGTPGTAGGAVGALVVKTVATAPTTDPGADTVVIWFDGSVLKYRIGAVTATIATV